MEIRTLQVIDWRTTYTYCPCHILWWIKRNPPVIFGPQYIMDHVWLVNLLKKQQKVSLPLFMDHISSSFVSSTIIDEPNLSFLQYHLFVLKPANSFSIGLNWNTSCHSVMHQRLPMRQTRGIHKLVDAAPQDSAAPELSVTQFYCPVEAGLWRSQRLCCNQKHSVWTESSLLVAPNGKAGNHHLLLGRSRKILLH